MKKIFIIMQFLFIGAFTLLSAKDIPHIILDSDGHKNRVWKVLFTNDEKYLVTCSDDKLIKVWDIETGACIRTIRGYMRGSCEGNVYSIALSPDNKYLVAGGWFKGGEYGDEGLGAVRIYDFNSGKLIRLLKGHKSVVYNLEFSPNGKCLASSSADSTVILWHLFDSDGKLNPIIQKTRLSYHKKGIYGISFSHDDHYLVSVSDDKSIAIWDLLNLSKNELPPHPYRSLDNAHGKEIKRVEYSMNDKYFATGSKDGTVKIWIAKKNETV